MVEKLTENFLKVQAKIEEILSSKELHIKQISDLERYVMMQCNIMDAILVAKKVAER